MTDQDTISSLQSRLAEVERERDSLIALQDNPAYCPRCGSCGIPECCGLKCAHLTHLRKHYDDMVIECDALYAQREVADQRLHRLEDKIRLVMDIHDLQCTTPLDAIQWFSDEIERLSIDERDGRLRDTLVLARTCILDLASQQAMSDPTYQIVVDAIDAAIAEQTG